MDLKEELKSLGVLGLVWAFVMLLVMTLPWKLFTLFRRETKDDADTGGDDAGRS